MDLLAWVRGNEVQNNNSNAVKDQTDSQAKDGEADGGGEEKSEESGGDDIMQ